MTRNWEIKGFLESTRDGLVIDGVSAADLAREHGTPLFIFSERRIRHNIDRLKVVAKVIDCPLKVCYAAKAMSTMAILSAVNEAGCDIEVNSGGELWKALEIGFTGDQIIFNGTSKEVWELEMAINAEIYAIQVDSLYELSLIEQTAERLGKRANVSLRLVPEIESDTHSGLQTALLTSKFGMMPDEAYRAFAEYKDSPRLRLAGVHLHVGSQNPDPAVYTEALRGLFGSMARILDETGTRLEHLNLGGGFPVDYLRDAPDAEKLSEHEAQMLSAGYAPDEALSNAWRIVTELADEMGLSTPLTDLTLLLEPGRSIVADTAVCLTSVRNTKRRPVAGEPDGEDHWLLTDAGFNILLSMETYKWYYHLLSAERAGEPHDSPYKVAGPLCDGGDVYFDIEGEDRLPDHRMLPANIEPGEVLALLNCGAYSLSQASQYNARFLPPVVLIGLDGEPRLIRRRDRFEDLVASDVF